MQISVKQTFENVVSQYVKNTTNEWFLFDSASDRPWNAGTYIMVQQIISFPTFIY